MESNKKNTKKQPNRLISLIHLFFILTIIFFPSRSFSLDSKVIAITEIVEHPSLEQAKQGILDVLAENGYQIDKNLQIIDKNAQGNVANSLLIAKKFVASSPDAIIAISTQSAQSVFSVAKDSNIPIIFTSVTDPVAAGLVKDLSIPTSNISGAMDFPLIEEEIKLIQELLPNIKTIGFLYSSGESNSVKTIALMKESMLKKIEFIEAVVANSNQVAQALTSLVGRVDAIYIPSDNTIFSAMPKLIKMSREYKLPIFSSDPDSVKQGVLACVGYSQYSVGRSAGNILVKVLSGARELPIQKPEQFGIFINKKSAKIMNIVIPSEIIGIKTQILLE